MLYPDLAQKLAKERGRQIREQIERTRLVERMPNELVERPRKKVGQASRAANRPLPGLKAMARWVRPMRPSEATRKMASSVDCENVAA